jgi:hypothetical protein
VKNRGKVITSASYCEPEVSSVDYLEKLVNRKKKPTETD